MGAMKPTPTPDANTAPTLLREYTLTTADVLALAERDHLLALIDPGHDEPLHALLAEHLPDALPLYATDADPMLGMIAPRLARLTADAAHALHQTAWSRPWGVLIAATLTPASVLSHLRRLVLARNPDGRTVLLRFFDHRVLAPLLRASDESELQNLFGPLTAWIAPGSPDSFTRFERTPRPTPRQPIEPHSDFFQLRPSHLLSIHEHQQRADNPT